MHACRIIPVCKDLLTPVETYIRQIEVIEVEDSF